MIYIKAFIENNEEKPVIKIFVEDNGVGITPEKLELLNEKLEKGIVDSDSGYGIYNVNERLRLFFGKKYGLRLESELYVGTKAVLTIPLIEDEEEIQGVSYSSGR